MINKEYSIVNPIHWIEESGIILANGETYSFDKRPYLMAMFTSKARLKCVRKARGLGFSETEILGSIHGLYSGRYRQGVQYVFPTDTDMRKFCQSRFNIVINRNRCLKELVLDTNTTNYKRIGGGNLFLDGAGINRVIEGFQKQSTTFISTQVDKAAIDELDMFEEANSVVESALTSMKNSTVKEVTILSNPSVENYGVDRFFQISNQNFWYRQCRCGELTCPDKEFPGLIDKQGCHCKVCGGLLTYRGIWKPDYPLRNDLFGIRSTDWEGYHISDLHAPNDDPYSIVEKFKDKSESNQEKLHRFSLGLPYTSKTNSLTLNEVYDCCGYQPEYETYDDQTIMGVDVGSSSGFHVVIGLKTGKNDYQVLRVDRLQGFEDVVLLGHRFNVKNCVCDIGPETTGAKQFQKTAGFKVWLCRYQEHNPVDEVVWDYDNRVVTVFRNYICDNTHRIIADKRIKLPRRNAKMEEFVKQYIVPIKKEKPNRPNEFFYWSPNRMDHYRHSTNYFLLACKISPVSNSKKKLSQSAIVEYDCVR